ncbi:MAG: hypothetical protein ACHP65_09235 [Legionellales bacterium]
MSTIPGEKPPVPAPKPNPSEVVKPAQNEKDRAFEFVKPPESKPELPLAI